MQVEVLTQPIENRLFVFYSEACLLAENHHRGWDGPTGPRCGYGSGDGQLSRHQRFPPIGTSWDPYARAVNGRPSRGRAEEKLREANAPLERQTIIATEMAAQAEAAGGPS